MKKIISFLTAVVIVSLLSTSCNKKLKENMEELETSLNEEKTKTETLQGQVNTLNSIVLKTPMSVSFSTTDEENTTVAFSGDYAVGYADHEGAFVMDNNNGSYYIYVHRLKEVSMGGFSGEISFTYNPTTQMVTNIGAGVTGNGAKGEFINADFYGSTYITQTVTVSAFDFNAGTITFNYSGNTTADYGDNEYVGKPMTLTLGYSGTLAKYYEPMVW